MSNTIVVLKGKSEISHELLKKTENKIFALDYNSHKILKKKSKIKLKSTSKIII